MDFLTYRFQCNHLYHTIFLGKKFILFFAFASATTAFMWVLMASGPNLANACSGVKAKGHGNGRAVILKTSVCLFQSVPNTKKTKFSPLEHVNLALVFERQVLCAFGEL